MYVKNKENFHLRLEVKYDFHKTHNAQKSNFTHIGQKNLDSNYKKPI